MQPVHSFAITVRTHADVAPPEPNRDTPAGASVVELSAEAKHLSEAGPAHDAASCETCRGGPGKLTEAERDKVAELKRRDAEVRQHEQAHKAAAAGVRTAGPTYEYERGPDGRQYAVAGQVDIDTSPVQGDPEATLRKAETIRRAALAPAEPSAQDRRVAAKADSMAAKARREMAAAEPVADTAAAPEVPPPDRAGVSRSYATGAYQQHV